MKIISITFDNSTKEYHYLLDPKSFVIPRKNDLLYRSEGFSKRTMFATILKVRQITETETMPEYVTSAIKILDINLSCQTYKLESKKEPTLSRIEREKIIYQQIHSFLTDFFKEEK